MNLEGKGSEREEAGSRHMASNLSRPVYIFSFHSSCKFFRSLSVHKKKSDGTISTTAETLIPRGLFLVQKTAGPCV